MPQRHSTGSSGSSSSSSRSSSSGRSSWRSSSSYHDYGDHEPSTPEEQALGWAILIVLLLVVGGIWIANQIKEGNERRADADATKTTQAITVQDLEEMHAALDSRLPVWQQVTDRQVHRASAEEAGFGPGSNTKEVDYGYCESGKFYVYVLEISRPERTYADTEGYAYTPGSNPRACHPSGWQIVSSDSAAKDWSFVTISTSQATYAARTPSPVQTESKQ